jgi:hypothetical protein
MEEHGNGHEEEISKALNVVSLDPNGKILGRISIPSSLGSAPSNPSLIPISDGVMLGYSTDNNFSMLALSAT